MLRNRTTVFVALVAAGLVASSISAGAGPNRTASPTSVRQPSGTTQEYVVAFSDDAATGVAAIEEAGGAVVDVNEDIGIALVTTENDAFVEDVSTDSAIDGAALNHSVGTVAPGMAHKWAEERPSAEDRAAFGATGSEVVTQAPGPRRRAPEPLADRQWGMTMIGATPSQAHRQATGRGVDVGIIDTGIDASHPDLAPNFDAERSRNFTMDIESVDGPCEVPTCIDPPDTDDNGHGTHVAGIVGADNNHFGVGGVAPDVTLVNLRAGGDFGYFFLYETVAALTEAGNLGLDVVNMSFFTDPWFYNCASRDDYISGDVTDEQIAEQALIRRLVLAAVDYAHQRGVTLVAAAGNSHLNLAAPTRLDLNSPDFPPIPPDSAPPRLVTNNCLDLPSEAPNVIQVSSVGPSTTKSDFSNYGFSDIEVSAPGGWARDFVGTPQFNQPTNRVLSSYPLHVAIRDGLADPNGNPISPFGVRYCDASGVCGFYAYLQGTSMASPHVVGVAALIVDKHGQRDRERGGRSLDSAVVADILAGTATDHACPAGGVEIYTDEGRPAEFNAVCEGDTDVNGLYGEGIVNANAAVQRR